MARNLNLWESIKDFPVMEIDCDVELAKPCKTTINKLRKRSLKNLAKGYEKTMKENHKLYDLFRKMLTPDYPLYQTWDNKIRDFMTRPDEHHEPFLQSLEFYTDKHRKKDYLRRAEIAEGIKECLNAAMEDIAIKERRKRDEEREQKRREKFFSG